MHHVIQTIHCLYDYTGCSILMLYVMLFDIPVCVSVRRYAYVYKYTRITEVNLFAFAYRLFHEDIHMYTNTQGLQKLIYLH